MRRAATSIPNPNRSQDETAVSLFPFLAVLICTMGALILLLVIIAQRARVQAAQNAQTQNHQLNTELKQKKEDAQWRIELLQGSLKKTQDQLGKARWQLSHVEDHTRQLREELARLERARQSIQSVREHKESNETEVRAQLDQIEQQILAVGRELDQAGRQPKQPKTSYALIPYQGPNETFRRPIYIECLDNRIVLQPEGIVFREADFRGPLGPENPLASTLRAAQEYLLEKGRFDKTVGQPYPLLIVRQSGIGAYYAARAAMESWDDEFGYELVDDKIPLDYAQPDPALSTLLRREAQSARTRQIQLTLAAPHHYARGGNGSFAEFAKPDSAREQNGSSASGSQPNPNQRYSVSSSGDVVPVGPASGGGGLSSQRNSRPRYARPSQLGNGYGGTSIQRGSYPSGTGIDGTGTGNALPSLDGTGGNGTGGNGPVPPTGSNELSGSFVSTPTSGSGTSPGSPGGSASMGTGSGIMSGTNSGTMSPGAMLPGATSSGSMPPAPMTAGSTYGGATNQTGQGAPLLFDPSASGGSSQIAGTQASGGEGSGASPTGGQTGGSTGGPMGESVSGNFGIPSPSGTGTSCGQPGQTDPSGNSTPSGSTINVNTPLPEDYLAGRPTPENAAGATGTASQPLRPGEWYPSPPESPRTKTDSQKMPPPQTTATNRPSRLARTRGANWGLPEASSRATALSRPIRVHCHADRLVLPGSKNSRQGHAIPFGPNTVGAVDPLVSAVWDRIDSWGIAGAGMYWRPILKIHVEPGGQQRFEELQTLMDGSGLTIESN